MKPTEFKEQNIVFAKNQPEYLPLPAFKSTDGQVVSCWTLTFRERLRLLFTGRLWSCVSTFNHSLQPQFLTTKKSEVLTTTEESHNI
jgi:hypothetical protein